MNPKRFLITTADERSWRFDRPVLFLGEWCRLYSSRDVWSGMDAKVADPFRINKSEKENDRKYIYSLSQKLLEELTNSLNEFHNTNHDRRYWNIILGHWLQRFVSVTFNRYFSLEKVLKENQVSGTVIFDLPDYKLATSNSIDFVWALYDNVWNHLFYARILNFLEKVVSESVSLSQIDNRKYIHDEHDRIRPTTKVFARDIANKILMTTCRNSDAFIVKSYLPFAYAFKLQLSLRQCPIFWNTPVIEKTSVDSEIRKGFRIDVEHFNGFDLFIRKMLGEMIPTCFLEGYSKLVQQTKTLPWPSNPKFIFTSNNFDTDEVFKVWTAHKVEEGHKYYIGQHGNNYGTWTYSLNFPEFTISDKFISWGWTNEAQKVIPAFIFNTVGRKQRRKQLKGGLLLIERCIHTRLTTYDNHYENLIYQNDQFRFVSSLPSYIKNLVTVRLYRHKLSNLIWSDEQRWKDYNPNILLDLNSTNIWKLINKNRIIVYSYDSTGILETLSLNIPTIGFWHGLLDEILPTAQPFYELLQDAGILTESPEKASKLISVYWDNIDEWWLSKKVQNARMTFCDKYARTVRNPVRELKSILIS